MKLRRALVAIIAGLGSPLVFGNVAYADIQGPSWSVTAATLNNGSSSNQVGFWQTLLYSNGATCNTIDGIFGNQTKSSTISFQQGVLGYPQPGKPADGVVGWITWSDTQNALWWDGFTWVYRLVNQGAGFHYYYGGGAANANLWYGYTPTGKWEFQHPFNGVYYYATNARTMPSIDIC